MRLYREGGGADVKKHFFVLFCFVFLTNVTGGTMEVDLSKSSPHAPFPIAVRSPRYYSI